MIFGKDSGGGAGTGEIQLNCSLAVLEWPVSEQTGGSPCRRVKKEIRKKRNRKRTRTSLRPMCRLTRRRKARASRPSTRSREKPDASGLIQSGDSQIARRSSCSLHESRNCREGHADGFSFLGDVCIGRPAIVPGFLNERLRQRGEQFDEALSLVSARRPSSCAETGGCMH